jgi:hypothetical protein
VVASPNSPVLLALPDPAVQLGVHVEAGRAFPYARFVYDGIFPSAIRPWYELLTSERAYWWLLLGPHRRDPAKFFFSFNAIEGRPGNHAFARRPTFAWTGSVPMKVASPVVALTTERRCIYVSLLDSFRRYDLRLLPWEHRAVALGERVRDLDPVKILGGADPR